MEDINEIHDKIIRKLEIGPALILELAETIEKDTLQTQTIVDYFVSRGEIKKTQRKFGSSAVYYLEKDKNKALDILMQTLNNQEKALITKVKEERVLDMGGLSSAERYISQNLVDFIKKVSAQDNQTGKKSDYLYDQNLSLEEVRNIINGKTEKKETQKIQKQKEKSESDVYKDKTYEIEPLLNKNGFENPKKIQDNLFLCEYGKNKTKVIVQIIKNKSINKKQLVTIIGYTSVYKTIAFIITNAQKIASTKSFGNMINIIKDDI